MPLIASKIATLKPEPGKKRKVIADIDGLHLQLRTTASGCSRTWIYRNQTKGDDRILTLGTYPEMSLQDARLKVSEIKSMIANGVDPWEQRRIEQYTENHGIAPDSFKSVAKEWFSKTKCNLTEGQKKRIWASLEKDVFPYIGPLSVKDIKPNQIVNIARRIESRGVYETCHRTISRIREVFDYSIVLEYCENNPASAVSRVLKPVEHGHFAALTEPNEVRLLLRKIYSYQGYQSCCKHLNTIRTTGLSKAWRVKKVIVAGHRHGA